MTSPLVMAHLPPVLTIAETASEIRRSPMHVYTLVRDGDLRAVRMSTSKRKKSSRESYVILADDLRDFIERRRCAR